MSQVFISLPTGRVQVQGSREHSDGREGIPQGRGRRLDRHMGRRVCRGDNWNDLVLNTSTQPRVENVHHVLLKMESFRSLASRSS